jgi:hypothetical protein
MLKPYFRWYIFYILIFCTIFMLNLSNYNHVRYDFRIQTMFGSSSVVCRRAHVLFTLFVVSFSGLSTSDFLFSLTFIIR